MMMVNILTHVLENIHYCTTPFVKGNFLETGHITYPQHINICAGGGFLVL